MPARRISAARDLSRMPWVSRISITVRARWKISRPKWDEHSNSRFSSDSLYHVEDPIRCLRQVAAVTGELCVIETVVDEVEGFAEWGSREWTRPYQGILALIDETGEFDAGNRETGVSPMATCPSPKALLFMLETGRLQAR